MVDDAARHISQANVSDGRSRQAQQGERRRGSDALDREHKVCFSAMLVVHSA